VHEGSSGGERGVVLTGLQATLRLARAERGTARELDAVLAPDAPPSPARAAALRVAASAALADEQFEPALQRAREAVAMAERVARAPTHSADVGEALLLQAKAQRAAGGDSRDSAARAAPILALSLGAEHALAREAQALALKP
jgi:eukaryotic-like serine/threonine-protein kinase